MSRGAALLWRVRAYLNLCWPPFQNRRHAEAIDTLRDGSMLLTTMHDEQRAESLALGLPRTAKHAERLEAIERLKRWKETAGHLGSYVANNEPERFQAELSAARGLLRELGEGANTKSDYMIYVTLATYEKLAPYRTTTEDTDAS